MQQLMPLSLRPQLIYELHDGVTGIISALTKLWPSLKRDFTGLGTTMILQNWCGNCYSCAQRKTPAPKHWAALKSVKTGYPLLMVAMDILGPFSESDSGNCYNLVVADYFTRWSEAYPIPNHEAITIAKILTGCFFFRFSIPEQIHSD